MVYVRNLEPSLCIFGLLCVIERSHFVCVVQIILQLPPNIFHYDHGFNHIFRYEYAHCIKKYQTCASVMKVLSMKSKSSISLPEIQNFGTSWHVIRMFYRSWFDRTKIRGHVWVDSLPPQLDAAGVDIQVQSDTSHLQYTGTGRRDYLRMARIVKDSFQLSTSTWPPGSVRWYGYSHDTSDWLPLLHWIDTIF